MMRGLALFVVGIAVLAAGCAGAEPTEVRAVFDDVVDLTVRGHVKISDVPVGIVSAIERTEDNRAMVTMAVDGAIDLPASMRARLRKTNVLGERFVELVPDREGGGAWRSGDVITDTEFVPEFEQLIESGSEVLAAVTADRIAAAIEAGAVGLGGRGETFDQMLDDVTEVVSRYDRNSRDLVRLIDGFEAFLSDVGPHAELHGRAFEELATAAQVLTEEDDRLIDTLLEVQQLSRTGTDIMTTHRERIDRFFTQFQGLTEEVVRRQEALERLFPALAMHNRNTIRGVHAEHAQVVLDFILCGENDSPGDPVRACDAPPQGQARPDPAPYNRGAR